jgi:hypothetical protein
MNHAPEIVNILTLINQRLEYIKTLVRDKNDEKEIQTILTNIMKKHFDMDCKDKSDFLHVVPFSNEEEGENSYRLEPPGEPIFFGRQKRESGTNVEDIWSRRIKNAPLPMEKFHRFKSPTKRRRTNGGKRSNNSLKRRTHRRT